MWPFKRRPKKESLQGRKDVSINGWKFTIRRVNPLLDFPADAMPQVFVLSGKKAANIDHPNIHKKHLAEMMSVVEAGVVNPPLVPVGKKDAHGREGGVTVEDIFRDPGTGQMLYWAIINHALGRSGFFQTFFGWIGILRLVWTRSLKGTEGSPVKSPSKA